ncbi:MULTISPECIES: toxin-antitoxin system HicB family antitoxin [unclassified Neglectibacter]|uniref:toxin-antitoxin system HicB family antitoxin n=1 Tax=unclassified Neglectibacter TaxID=2632164 RepID=UPI00210FEF86|nr:MULTISPECIES: toxin-antitoxin system HicB family antitoxin [unclassified Neglectibacter]
MYLPGTLLQRHGQPERQGAGYEQPVRTFTGNFTVRTTPAIHDVLTLYAVKQGTIFSQVTQTALFEFLENYDIQVVDGEG